MFRGLWIILWFFLFLVGTSIPMIIFAAIEERIRTRTYLRKERKVSS